MDDLISRQAAIDGINELMKVHFDRKFVLGKARTIMQELPPAQPEIKQQAINSSDYIDRRAALDALRKMQTYKLFSGDDMLLIDQAGAMTELMLLPSAQLEIIRCKDCKNWDTTWTNDFSPNYHYCPMVDGVRKEDWFCADAERRTDE